MEKLLLFISLILEFFCSKILFWK